MHLSRGKPCFLPVDSQPSSLLGVFWDTGLSWCPVQGRPWIPQWMMASSSSSSGPEHHVTIATPSQLWQGFTSWSQQPQAVGGQAWEGRTVFLHHHWPFGCWLACLFSFNLFCVDCSEPYFQLQLGSWHLLNLCPRVS